MFTQSKKSSFPFAYVMYKNYENIVYCVLALYLFGNVGRFQEHSSLSDHASSAESRLFPNITLEKFATCRPKKYGCLQYVTPTD